MNPSALLLILLSAAGLGLIVAYALTSRRRAMSRMAGSFDCSIRVGEGTPRPRWRLGVGLLTATTFNWYPVFGFSRRPAIRLPRADMVIASRSEPAPDDRHSVLADAQVIVLRCGDHAGRPVKTRVALERDAVSALSSWLESSPPGYNLAIGRFT